MKGLLVFALISIVLVSCKKKDEKALDATVEAEVFSFQNLPKEQTFSSDAQAILNSWSQFKEMENSFDVMYRAENNEDLALAIDDLLEKELELGKSEYPDPFNTSRIKSRQKVLRTYMLKVKASIADNTDVVEPMRQMLDANNAFRNQFNVIIGNTLDTKLILDEG